jgi:hypothetical protein
MCSTAKVRLELPLRSPDHAEKHPPFPLSSFSFSPSDLARMRDTLSQDSIGRIEAAVKEVDEHLRVVPATVGDNQAVILITE